MQANTMPIVPIPRRASFVPFWTIFSPATFVPKKKYFTCQWFTCGLFTCQLLFKLVSQLDSLHVNGLHVNDCSNWYLSQCDGTLVY
jgi:hypothetical protein